MSKVNRFVLDLGKLLDNYHIPEATRSLSDFLNDLSRWYIRRSRDRLKAADKEALTVLRQSLVVFSKAAAPFIPFITETVYQGLRGEKESVHLEDWPLADENLLDGKLEEEMELGRKIVNLALSQRTVAGIKTRQKLQELIIGENLFQGRELCEEILETIKEEVNVNEISFDKKLGLEVFLSLEMNNELIEEGALRDIIRFIQQGRKSLGLTPKDRIAVRVGADNDRLLKLLNQNSKQIKERVLADGFVAYISNSKPEIMKKISIGGLELKIEKLA